MSDCFERKLYVTNFYTPSLNDQIFAYKYERAFGIGELLETDPYIIEVLSRLLLLRKVLEDVDCSPFTKEEQIKLAVHTLEEKIAPDFFVLLKDFLLEHSDFELGGLPMEWLIDLLYGKE